MTTRWIGFIVLSLGLCSASSRADAPAVSIADLAAYQAAIVAGPTPTATTPVTFRDLWDHPQTHQGTLVRVDGRVARLFRQPAVGQFPPLTEAWITSPLGEPTCLVFPSGAGRSTPALGAQVRFAGTFLRLISYPGGDTKRVAPLIVGPGPPSDLDPAAAPGGPSFGPIFGGDHAADWAIGLAAALGVAGVLARRHLNRPLVVAPPVGPAPTFLDGDASQYEIPEEADDDDF